MLVLCIKELTLLLFNPEPVPRFLKRSLVIFSGGKLENRKGQDIVIAAFPSFVAPSS